MQCVLIALMVGFVSLGLIAPAGATSYIGMSTTNLTGGADLIVVGTTRRGAQGANAILTTQIVKGAAAGTVALSTSRVRADDELRDGMTAIFFLMADNDPAQAGRFRPYHRDWYRPIDELPQVRKVVAALADDAKLEELLRETESVLTSEVIGYRLKWGKRTPMKEPTASQVIAYLRARLDSADYSVVYHAVEALPRTPGDTVAVKKLFEHRYQVVRQSALRWFLGSNDPSIVPDLCAYIASRRPFKNLTINTPHETLEEAVFAGQVLEAVAYRAGSRALPCLEAGAERGLEGGVTALGLYGNERSFPFLLANVDANPGTLSSALLAMSVLVRRSNKPVEEWMTNWMTVQTSRADLIAKLPIWRAWWQDNQQSFRIVRSHVELRR